MVIPYPFSDWKNHADGLEFLNIVKNSYLIVTTPHENEPLGNLIFNKAFFEACDQNQIPISFCTNLDIPTLQGRFDIPTTFKDFFLNFSLKEITQQVEFSYTTKPISSAEKRAYCFWKHAFHAILIISIHNDPTRDIFYAYSHEDNPVLNDFMSDINKSLLNVSGSLEKVSYTDKLNDFIYKYFSFSNILPEAKNESFGAFFKRNTINLEIPMFDWKKVNEDEAKFCKKLYLNSVQNGLSSSERKKFLLENSIMLPEIPMIPLEQLREGLTAIVLKIIQLHIKGQSDV